MKELLNNEINVSDNDTSDNDTHTKKKYIILIWLLILSFFIKNQLKIFSKPLSIASVSFSSAFYSIPLFLKARPNKLPKNEPILLRARLYHGVFYYYY